MTHKARSKGRHTTTHRELISLKNGAFVIDTPGMREIGIMNSGEGIEAAEEFFILYDDIAREYIQTNF